MSNPSYKLAAQNINKYRRSSLHDSIRKFSEMEKKTEEELKKNPYSETYVEPKFNKKADDYGRPPPGSRTEARGIKASVHVCREILFLMETINSNAQGEEPNRYIDFGNLFRIYSRYSDKLVGMLIRARKYGLLEFEGEMLYQKQDDHKLVTMTMSLKEIQTKMRPTGDPKNCVALV